MTRIEEMVLASATRGPDGRWRFEEKTAEKWTTIGDGYQYEDAEAHEAYRIAARLEALDRTSARQEIGIPSGGQDIPLPPGAVRAVPHEKVGVLSEDARAGQVLCQDPDDCTWYRYDPSAQVDENRLRIAVENGRAGDTIILTTSRHIHVVKAAYPSLLSGEGGTP